MNAGRSGASPSPKEVLRWLSANKRLDRLAETLKRLAKNGSLGVLDSENGKDLETTLKSWLSPSTDQPSGLTNTEATIVAALNEEAGTALVGAWREELRSEISVSACEQLSKSICEEIGCVTKSEKASLWRVPAEDARRSAHHRKDGPTELLDRYWACLWSKYLSRLVAETKQQPRSLQSRAPQGEDSGESHGLDEASNGETPAPGKSAPGEAPGVDFWELAERVRPYEFEPSPQELLRKTRRWWSRFRLEAFVEDRTFADYRNVLEQERNQLLEQARQTVTDAWSCIDAVDTIRECLAHQNGADLEALKVAADTARTAAHKATTDERVSRETLEGAQAARETAKRAHEAAKQRLDASGALGSEGATRDRSLAQKALKNAADVEAKAAEAEGVAQDAATKAQAVANTERTKAEEVISPYETAAAMHQATVALDRIKAGLGETLQLADAMQDVLQDRHFDARLTDRLRVLHGEVQERWGTWPRRIKSPILFGLLGLLAVGVFQSLYGLFWGTQQQVWLALLLPVVLFLLFFYRGLNGVVHKIDRAIRPIAAFDPEPEASSKGSAERYRDATIWRAMTDRNGSPKKLARAAYAALIHGGTEGPTAKKFKSSNTTVSAFWYGFFLVALLFALALPIFIAKQLPPQPTSVEAQTASGHCKLAVGAVIWPGPGEVIVWSVKGEQGDAASSGIVAVPRATVARMLPDSQSEAPFCDRPISGDRAAGGAPIIVIPDASNQERAVYVVPFVLDVGPIACNFATEPRNDAKARKGACADDLHVCLSEDQELILGRLGEALKKCGATNAPTIDVRGFASSREFVGNCGENSNRLNVDLANLRRNRVLHAMFRTGPQEWTFRRQSLPDKWEVQGVKIDPGRVERFTSVEHMNEISRVRDDPRLDEPPIENITRRVEIWLKNPGGCSRSDLAWLWK